MATIENIKLSFQCKEEINKMDPCSIGRQCSSCNKTVIDFRNRDLSFLTKTLEENCTVCGIFSRNQIQTTNKKGYFKKIIASLLIAIGLGTTKNDLFAQSTSCDSLTPNNSKVTESEIIVGGVHSISPTYKDGGQKGLNEFLAKNINYPKDSVQGKVLVRFTIDTTGKTIDIKILKGLSEEADNEVIRVVKLLEFIPAVDHGKNIPIRFTLPVTFSLNNDTKSKK